MIGIILVIISGVSGGQIASYKLIDKVRFIEEYMEFIKNTENEIRYSGILLEEIIFKQKGNSRFSHLAKKCSVYIKQGDSFHTAWEKAFSPVKNELFFSSSFFEILMNFGLKLGTSDVSSQISHCKYNFELAKSYLETAREEKKAKCKLYRILGISTGIALALFLV